MSRRCRLFKARDASYCAAGFAQDLLREGHREFCRCRTCASTSSTAPIGARLPRRYHTRNPLSFTDLQHVQEVTNFFAQRVWAYQVGGTCDVV
ncbi:MAG TPA: hypothetical protein VMF89_16225 [Polyangiales bacterium]|nr:hypothetical protein [Polyangiales bacterium]